MKTILFTFILSIWTLGAFAQLDIGDKAVPFQLKNVDGKMVQLSDYSSEKGVVIIFTCNHCPFSKAYEDRIIAIDKAYKSKGLPVVAINPNDPTIVPEDSYEKMMERAAEKKFTFPYLFDETQQIYKAYGATKTPHVYLLANNGGKFNVVYIGAIDDNAKDENNVKNHYLKNAMDALLKNKPIVLAETKAIGCSIKSK